MSVVSDGTHYEKIIIFGGIQNNIKTPEELAAQQAMYKQKAEEDEDENNISIVPSQVSSFLTNKTYLISVNQRPQNIRRPEHQS
jgi:uncharacterized protein YcfJ